MIIKEIAALVPANKLVSVVVIVIGLAGGYMATPHIEKMVKYISSNFIRVDNNTNLDNTNISLPTDKNNIAKKDSDNKKGNTEKKVTPTPKPTASPTPKPTSAPAPTPAPTPVPTLTPAPIAAGRIVNHTNSSLTSFKAIPLARINSAHNLKVYYGHTSHGSQLITAMRDLINFGAITGNNYIFCGSTSGVCSGITGKLTIYDAPAGYMDLGFAEWPATTRTFLNSHPDTDVVIWSWCGQLSYLSTDQVNTYLNTMNQLESEYPSVKFVYMTGHLDATSTGGVLHRNNQQIRAFVSTNNKYFYDFADIESYNPDGVNYMSQGAGVSGDGCVYAGGNWCDTWQASHAQGVDWYNTAPAHTGALNGNLKAYGAWQLWSLLAD